MEATVLGRDNLDKIKARAMSLLADDPQVADTMPITEVSKALCAPGLRLSQIVAIVMEAYQDRPAFGERAFDLVKTFDGRTERRLLDRFNTITYREVWQRVGAISSAWRHGSVGLAAGDFAAMIGRPGIDYAVLDLVCIRSGLVSVPLPATGTPVAIAAMLDEVRPPVFAAGVESLRLGVDAMLAASWTPRQLLVFDYLPEITDQRAAFEDAVGRLREERPDVDVVIMSELLDTGADLPDVEPHVDETDNGDKNASCLIYTSGSTGSPKAVIHTEHMTKILWTSASAAPSIVVTYMPLSHFYGRAFLHTTTSLGGLNYFVARGDMSSLFEDMAIARPTMLPLVPRVCEMIAHRYRTDVERRVAAGTEKATAEQEAKEVVRSQSLGGRYLWAICASAPLSAEMNELMKELLDAPLIISYGATEVLNVCIAGVVSRPPVIDYKLEDVPELGYFNTDKPYPRGELLVKTENVMGGYFNRPELTAELIDADGYYRTGDIMAETAPDRLIYVDRRNNVLKLSQGEFVATSQLEATYATNPLIWQIFVHGDSEQSFLLAVVVPHADLADLDDAELKRQLREALNTTAIEAGLQSYENPRDFLIEREPFTEDNKLLTSSGKLARPELTAHYKTALQQMYADIAAMQDSDRQQLRAGAADRPVLETVKLAIQATLGISAHDLEAHTQFIDIGGDSLTALSLSTLLEDTFGIDVPVSGLIDPTTDLGYLADGIEARLHVRSDVPTPSSVHGSTARVAARELTLDKFIDADVLARAPELDPVSGDIRTVFVTGVTGFLGRFQVLEWMEEFAARGVGKVICIARGNDNAQARQRVTAAFDSDPELAATFSRLAADHLEVLAGDLSAPALGLGDDDWQRLAKDVDLIIHTGALVNHMLGYRQLFGPNVCGTAQVLCLAMTHRLKQMTYVSTLGVAASENGLVDEDTDIRIAIPEQRIDDSGYANGYAVSKWAGEVMCREAYDLCGLPVAVFRCNMILAHSRYSGQLNIPDVFSRLLISLLITGIVPQSFYSDGADVAHYDGLPVDFIARATARLGAAQTTGFDTYNIVNPHDDGISTDTFVMWMREAGYQLQPVADFYDWRQRFEAALRALPEGVRQHTLINLLSVVGVQGVASPGSPFLSKRFCAAVEADPEISGGSVPHVTRELIVKYAEDLTRLGYATSGVGDTS